MKKTVTSLLFQPLAFASGLRLPVIIGAVLSMLMPPTVAGEAAFPALSTQSPLFVTDWPPPSAAESRPSYRVCRDSGLNGAGVGAGEEGRDVRVVPAARICFGASAAADYG